MEADELPASTGVGEELARARMARGLSLADVAQLLKFAPRQLEALEQERFGALPGATFARGMVRSYARLLKLDPEPLLQRLDGCFSSPDDSRLTARFRQPLPFSESGRRSTVAYLALSVGCLAVAGVVGYEWHRERTAPAPMTFVAPARSPASPVESPRPALPIGAQVASAAPLPEIVKAEPSPKALEERPAPAAKAGAGRLVFRCEQESWIEVRDSSGRILAASLNAAGSERVIEGKGPFRLIVGNAQHVRVSYDGDPVDLQPHVKVEVARLTLP
jgi:cytoskeleton protein RodZ